MCQKPTWSTLASSIGPGDDTLHLSSSVEWNPGTRVLVASTDYSALQNEVATIESVERRNNSVTVVKLDRGMKWPHAGVAPITAEVAALTRNIVIRGEQGCDAVPNTLSNKKPMCGHFMISRTPRGVICGVEFTRMGQHSTTGRYPLHLHVCGDTSKHRDGPILVSHNSVRDNHHRGIVLHATSSAIVQDNILFRTRGHLMLTEDGAEEGNKIVRNIFTLANPIKWQCEAALDKIGAVRNGKVWVTKSHGKITGTCERHRCSHGTGTLASICGNRHDDTANGLWLSNPANYVAENRAIGAASDAAFRFEVRGLTGIAAGMRNLVRFGKSKGQGAKGAFRDNVAHSALIGVKNYPNWGPSTGVRIERLTAWKNTVGLLAKTPLTYAHPYKAVKSMPCQVPSMNRSKAMLGLTDKTQCVRRYTVERSTFMLNGVAITTINGAKAHIVESVVAPTVPSSGCYSTTNGCFNYTDVTADDIAIAGACNELGRTMDRDKNAVCRFRIGKKCFKEGASRTVCKVDWRWKYLSVQEAKQGLCVDGECETAGWYVTSRHKGRMVVLTVPDRDKYTKQCYSTHGSQIIHGADAWRSMRSSRLSEYTFCLGASNGKSSRFPAVSVPWRTNKAQQFWYTAFREAKHAHQFSKNWAITIDKPTRDAAVAAGFVPFEARLTHGSTGLAGIGASLGSFNKGYVVYGKRMRNRYARSLSDPQWDAPLGNVTLSMNLPPSNSTEDEDDDDDDDRVITLSPTEAPTARPTKSITVRCWRGKYCVDRSKFIKGGERKLRSRCAANRRCVAYDFEPRKQRGRLCFSKKRRKHRRYKMCIMS